MEKRKKNTKTDVPFCTDKHTRKTSSLVGLHGSLHALGLLVDASVHDHAKLAGRGGRSRLVVDDALLQPKDLELEAVLLGDGLLGNGHDVLLGAEHLHDVHIKRHVLQRRVALFPQHLYGILNTRIVYSCLLPRGRSG